MICVICGGHCVFFELRKIGDWYYYQSQPPTPYQPEINKGDLRIEGLRAFARQDVSPNERDIARQKLTDMGLSW